MTSPFDAEIEGLLAGYREQVAQVAVTVEQMRGLTATATAPRRTVQITVNAQGDIATLEFPTSRYKELPPAELSSIILATAAEARADIARQVAELSTATMPGTVDVEALRAGTIGLGTMLPAEPVVHEDVKGYSDHGRPSGRRKG